MNRGWAITVPSHPTGELVAISFDETSRLVVLSVPMPVAGQRLTVCMGQDQLRAIVNTCKEWPL